MTKEEEIRNEIKRLEKTTDKQLINYNEKLTKKRTLWFARNKNSIKLQTKDSIDTAYHLLLEKFGISEEQMPIIERSRNKIVFHSINFCPTLEACKTLGLDTRRVCSLYNEKATDALIKLVDPELKFTRNYDRLRPYAPYCEEMIVRVDDGQF